LGILSITNRFKRSFPAAPCPCQLSEYYFFGQLARAARVTSASHVVATPVTQYEATDEYCKYLDFYITHTVRNITFCESTNKCIFLLYFIE